MLFPLLGIFRRSRSRILMSDFPWHEADAMFLLLIRRAADLQTAAPVAAHEEELDCVSNVVAAYEAKRWPDGSKPI
jgi:hypothetical protein